MKLLLLFMCLLTFSCNTGQTGNVDKPKVYSDTSSLFCKGTPLFVFNESIDKLGSRASFYKDTVNRQGGCYSYLIVDTFFTVRQSTGTMIGNLLIETNNLRQIQRVRGYWEISVQMNDKTRQEAIDSIRQRFFPNMPQNFLLTEADTTRHKSFVEEFKFFPSPDSGDIDHGYVPHWSFYYDAKRSKNGL
ncbi:hypothetical protein [Foetidibacter luteolus]|uniref:hypothetical protein n=1 Tax=Foetidibacter luteolus TaxID=2608880 RepID=UPI00129A8E0A|nr:hypothetical protein [Foetidibacter luteolus]